MLSFNKPAHHSWKSLKKRKCPIILQNLKLSKQEESRMCHGKSRNRTSNRVVPLHGRINTWLLQASTDIPMHFERETTSHVVIAIASVKMAPLVLVECPKLEGTSLSRGSEHNNNHRWSVPLQVHECRCRTISDSMAIPMQPERVARYSLFKTMSAVLVLQKLTAETLKVYNVERSRTQHGIEPNQTEGTIAQLRHQVARTRTTHRPMPSNP